jgi:hypothetical protein
MLAMENLPDEKLMKKLEGERGRGRDDYPVRAMWNSLVAMVVFEHPSVESLRRELGRNGQLRWICGFRNSEVPSSSAYSRFIGKLKQNEGYIRGIFEQLVKQLSVELEGFGERLAVDGKAVQSHARPTCKDKEPDGRRDTDADYGVKTYHSSDGSIDRDYWYGYQLSLVADTQYELPVTYSVTKASRSEVKEAEKLVKENPDIFERCRVLTADRGYDSGPFIRNLWEEHKVKAVIDIRNFWRDGEDDTRLLEGWPNVVYNYRGEVFCYCPETAEKREMPFGGFEKDRETLKYRCPAWQYDSVQCAGSEKCPVESCLRIPLSEDRRIFTPLARSSYRWDTLYEERTAVERLNSRLEVSFGLRHHFVRGLQKMKVKVGLALSVMLAMAAGRVREDQEELMRSLVQPA